MSKKPERAAWGSISRATVIDAAVAIVSGDGPAELSIRTLASRLNVSPMALYRHVENKDDLLDEVVNRLLAKRWRPRTATKDWRAWITEAADRFRRFLVEQPAALQVYLRRPVASSTALRRMEACLDVLADGLGDRNKARSAYAAIQTYTIGFAALEAARAAAPALPDASAPQTPAQQARREVAEWATPRQFRLGVDYLLTGVGSS